MRAIGAIGLASPDLRHANGGNPEIVIRVGWYVDMRHVELVVDAERPVVAIGECMLELSCMASAESGRLGKGWTLGIGGDTYNTAVHLCRQGLPVHYLTALGQDRYSAEMLATWRSEGLETGLVLRHPQQMPGLYAIHTDAGGERSFAYWRSHSAVRSLFELRGVEKVLATAAAAGLLYLSGITLSLFAAAQRARLVELARRVRAAGGVVAFDANYRPAGWEDVGGAREAVQAIAPHVSIALPTQEDERQLFGDARVDHIIDRWSRYGAAEVIVKRGAAGCVVGTASGRVEVPAIAVDKVIDTTGAGDAFNAGYLAARSYGSTPREAAGAAVRLAARVVQHRGAIPPREEGSGR